jgi:hypothetical protein
MKIALIYPTGGASDPRFGAFYSDAFLSCFSGLGTELLRIEAKGPAEIFPHDSRTAEEGDQGPGERGAILYPCASLGEPGESLDVPRWWKGAANAFWCFLVRLRPT